MPLQKMPVGAGAQVEHELAVHRSSGEGKIDTKLKAVFVQPL